MGGGVTLGSVESEQSPRRFIILFSLRVPGGLRGGRAPAFVSVKCSSSPLRRWLRFFLGSLSGCNESAYETALMRFIWAELFLLLGGLFYFSARPKNEF